MMTKSGSIINENIGIILVHGIGEQRRFQHLDSQARQLVSGLKRLEHQNQIDHFSVDISGTGAAAFHAEQDTWNAGPTASVDIVVRHRLHGTSTETHLKLHEVWWADVNEPYSIAKQLRFWCWGLGIWAHPGQRKPKGASSAKVSAHHRLSLWNRVQLFLVGTFFVLAGYSIGVVGIIAVRVFNLRPSKYLRVLANYISAVKLYSQSSRAGPGLYGQEDFLDNVGFPPRLSIRRRMMRTVADVVLNEYSRWYILAHSQGTVVAFNALMDTAEVWPAYLDQERWLRLKKAGVAGTCQEIAEPYSAGSLVPPRPIWVEPTEILLRNKLFEKFSGFLTYGSPLAKFDGIWPGIVPVAVEPAFSTNVPWLNLYDPLDPVSGRLADLYSTARPGICPSPADIGYSAGPILLAAHLQYLMPKTTPVDALSATLHWFLTDCTAGFPRQPASKSPVCNLAPLLQDETSPRSRDSYWFTYRDKTWWWRTFVAWFSWLAASAVLALIGAFIFPALLRMASKVGAEIWTAFDEFGPQWGIGRLIRCIWAVISSTVSSTAALIAGFSAWTPNVFFNRAFALVVTAVLLTAVVGASFRLYSLLRR